MSVERRPHWTDELIEGVRSKIGMHQHGPIGEIRIYNPFDDEVYNVIAAVEDWQDARGDAIDGNSLTEAVHQVARVREACDEALHEDPMPQGSFRRGYNMAMKVVSRLLDGAQDD